MGSNKAIAASGNVTHPCYADPAAAECATFARLHKDWTADQVSLCAAMPFMSGCSLWKQCKVRADGRAGGRVRRRRRLQQDGWLSAGLPQPRTRRASQEANLTSTTYCKMVSVVGDNCADMPKVRPSARLFGFSEGRSQGGARST